MKPIVFRRAIVGLVAVLGGALMIVASLLTWISTPTETGGRTMISGWGAIAGDSDIAGTNLNDVLALGGSGTYRPGLLALIFGVIGVIGGLCVAAVAGGRRPHRITAAVLAVCGLVGLVWGIIRIVAPGGAGVLDPGERSAGPGPWLLAAGGVVVLLIAGGIVAGVLDRPEAVHSRGIQPG